VTRLYVTEAPLAVGSEIALPDAARAHIRARRVREGEAIALFDGSGNEFSATLLTLDRRDALVRIDSVAPGLGFASPNLIIALSVIAADRMDWAIQKCCELGVVAILPILAGRSQAPGNAASKVSHWQAVAAAAAEQSGRAQVAKIEPPLTIQSALNSERFSLKNTAFAPQVWMCEQRAEGAGLNTSAPSNCIFIGPEGGWTDEERAQFLNANARTLVLSRATLRSETAAVAAAVKLLQI
jgi:16S rRNA (uracil1498-N3)-methyltransferase